MPTKDKNVVSPRSQEAEIVPASTTPREGISTQRRKLVKASAAALPAIMTLRSGAAAAVTSMHACIEEDAQRAIAQGPLDNVLGDAAGDAAHDEWLRVIGKAGRWIKGSGSVNYFAIRTETAAAKPWDDRTGWTFYDKHGNPLNNTNPISNAEWTAATNFFCVDKGSSWECVQEGGTGFMPTVPVSGTNISAGVDVQLLVYVQSMDGQITSATYYPSTLDQMGTNITNSCWCSVNPTNNLLGLG